MKKRMCSLMLTRKLAYVSASWHTVAFNSSASAFEFSSLRTPRRHLSSLLCDLSSRCCRDLCLDVLAVDGSYRLSGESSVASSRARAMANRKEERKGNLLASAVIGAAGLALGWAALELGFGGILKPGREAMDRSLEPKEVNMEDPAVLLVEQVANEAKQKENRSDTQIEEDNIVEALDEGSRKDHQNEA